MWSSLKALNRFSNLRLWFGSGLVTCPLEECSHRVSGDWGYQGTLKSPEVFNKPSWHRAPNPQPVSQSSSGGERWVLQHLVVAQLRSWMGWRRAAVLTAVHSWNWKRFLQDTMGPSLEASQAIAPCSSSISSWLCVFLPV